MAEEGLHIDTHSASTGESIPVEHEHNPEEVNKDSGAHTDVDPESSSEETEESSFSDDPDKTAQDLSPTTTIHPDPHEHELEKHNEGTTLTNPIEPETSTEETPHGSTESEENDTKVEHIHEEQPEENSVPTHTEPEHSGEEPVQHSLASEPPKEDEVEQQPLPANTETENPIEDVSSNHATSVEAEPEKSEEENLDEKPQDTPESSVVEQEEASKDIHSDPLHPAKIEPETTSEEEAHELTEPGEIKSEEKTGENLLQPSNPDPVEPETTSEEEAHELGEAREIKSEETAGEEVIQPSNPDPAGPEATAESSNQEPQVPTKPEEPITNPTTEASKEPTKPAPSDREKRALDTVKRSRVQFRVALDIFLQLISENEDDEGTIRLNLVERDSDLRKTVGMLGLKLQNVVDAEKELDWAQLLDRYETRDKA
jgi:hypothetical protein